MAKELRLARNRVPFSTRLPALVRLPLRNPGLLLGCAAALAVVTALTSGDIVAKLFGIGTWMLRFAGMALFWSAFFRVLQAVQKDGTRDDRVEAFSFVAFSGVFDDLSFGVRGTLVMLPFLFLANVGITYVIGTDGGEHALPFWLASSVIWTPLETDCLVQLPARLSAASPLMQVLAVLDVALTPMLIIGCAQGGGLWAGLNPWAATLRALRVGKDYALAGAFSIGLATLALTLAFALQAPASRVPFLGPGLLATFVVYLWLVAAAALGLVGYVHGDRLGTVAASETTDFALPGVVPRGKRA